MKFGSLNDVKMSKTIHMYDAVQWYMHDLTSQIVAETGIPSDRFHLGKILFHSMKETDPEMIMQIDGGTGQSENYGSVLKRTVKCANALRKLGIKKGDVMALMAPNHLDVVIPFYAALYLGVIIAPVNRTLIVSELQYKYTIYRPKIIFCENERVPYIQEALNNIEYDAEIITFDKGDRVCSFSEFLDKFGDDTSVENFRPTDFDAEDTIAFLLPTSGTTGPQKAAVATHKNFAITLPSKWARYTQFPTPTRLVLIVAPLQWLSTTIHFMDSVILKYPRVQSSLPITQEHAYHLINTYRPSFMMISPTMMATLIKPMDGEQCDFTYFDSIWMGGTSVPQTLINEIKTITPETEIIDIYGLSEATGFTFQDSNPPKGSCGKRISSFQYKLTDMETGKIIDEPNVPGELWLKSPGIFKRYYNDPEATEAALIDEWFKTGDIFYRDENWNYYFVERIKLLIKYREYLISPMQLENVIRMHSGVLDVAVTSVPDRECGELLVACVVPNPGHTIIAQEVKDLVKDSLTDAYQLRGGVIFMSELPRTASTKIDRQKLKQIVLTTTKE